MRTLVLSDIHLGAPTFKKKEELRKLLSLEWDRIVLNGDIIDLWWMYKKDEIIKRHQDIFDLLNKHKNVVCINGNHDPCWNVLDHTITLPNSKRVLITHGSQFTLDGCPFFYQLNLLFYCIFHIEIRRVFRKLKSYESMISMAKSTYRNHDYIILGHTHNPTSDSPYFNSGDLIEHFSYIIVEDNDIKVVQL
jgi:predicted phosphodiesterase